jgi:hypothetical protein
MKVVFLYVVLFVIGTFNGTSLAMDNIESGRFTVYFSGSSRKIAERILTVTKASYPVLKAVFNADHDLRLEIFWADRSDWPKIPQCRYKANYGMPHMAKGEDHTYAIILPAADIDMPEQLFRLVNPLLDISKLSQDDLRRLARLLSTGREVTTTELKEYLSSSEFYTDFLVEIVLVHEIMHNFCYEFGIPENYGRNGQKAWWVFEGLAQWSVLWVHRQLGNDHWAELHELLYRWMYRTGRNHQGNISPVQYENYAWFHGALVEMFVQLEGKFGRDYGPAVLSLFLDKIKGRDFLNNREVVEIFSHVSGQDLSAWFKLNWQIE